MLSIGDHQFGNPLAARKVLTESHQQTPTPYADSILTTFISSKAQLQRFWHPTLLSVVRLSDRYFSKSSNIRDCSKDSKEAEVMAAVDMRRGSERPGPMVGGPISGMIHRPSLAENVRTASRDSGISNLSASTIPAAVEEKPIASGNGVSLSISLAEPLLFLQGYDQSELANQNTTMLRGSFHLRVSKSAKIKTISLTFRGRAETEWPEGQFSNLQGLSLANHGLGLTCDRYPTQKDRIQRQGKHNESHLAIFQRSISNR